MTRFVLDASVALSWFVDVPIDPYAVQVRAQMVGGRVAVVPRLWELEFANGLLTAERKGIIDATESGARINEVEQLKKTCIIEVEEAQLRTREVLAAARTFQLTAYDAAYLELALREGLALATLDRRLAEAAEKAGVKRA